MIEIDDKLKGKKILYHFRHGRFKEIVRWDKDILEGVIIELSPSKKFIRIKTTDPATTGREPWHLVDDIIIVEVLE